MIGRVGSVTIKWYLLAAKLGMYVVHTARTEKGFPRYKASFAQGAAHTNTACVLLIMLAYVEV